MDATKSGLTSQRPIAYGLLCHRAGEWHAEGGEAARRVPQPVTPARHDFKYALFFGRPGERLVLFDNERGKGDHKHILGVKSPYEFSTPEQLISDFEAAVSAARAEDKR